MAKSDKAFKNNVTTQQYLPSYTCSTVFSLANNCNLFW